jgi:hypothetical protein
VTDAFEPFVPRRVSGEAGRGAEQPQAAETQEKTPGCTVDAVPDAPPVDRTPACDPDVCAVTLREMAIRLAGAACARALHEAIARNPLFITRFVDDALRAAGAPPDARARLRPDAAALCAGRVPCEVVADGGMAPGAVEIQTGCGSLRATLEERALALARAAADA